MKRNVVLALELLVVLSIVLAACAPAATTPAAPVVVTQIVKETVAPQVVTKEVQVPVTVAAPVATAAPDKVQIYWYIGLGTGAQPAQIPLEKAWVEKYNKTQGATDGIQLIPIIVDNKYAPDNLTAQIAAGNSPDIVGPVGNTGRAQFPGAFLDLTPYITKFNYNTSDIDPAFMNFYKVNGLLEALPFAIYPSALFYNKALFDQAGLKYPPQKVGDKYNLDGKDVDWTFDTVAEVAKRLTLDKSGNDATSAKFDAKNIVQYGFTFQWVSDSPRWFTAYFEPHYPVVNNKADISAGQIAGMKWYYDSLFGKQPFAPNAAAINSDLLGKGNAFNSGKVAMGITHLWYTCCLDDPSKGAVKSWDVGVIPSYNGKTTAKLHGDTFAIMKGTKHPDEAFKVYSYILGAGSAELYTIYGAYPVRKAQQADYIASLDKKYAPNKINWQVFVDMIPFMEVPSHEAGLPNELKAEAAWTKLGSDLASTPNLNVDKRIADFVTEFNGILAAAPTPTP
jgi:multiple sugar transport system substrate-binding protein